MEVSPRDKFGNLYIDIIVNHTSKLAKLYAKPEKTTVLSAISLFQFMCSYGLFDVLMTDPGSDFTSEVMGHLTRWFGVDHKLSLVDRHESCGVEGTNKQVARHVRVLTQEERIINRVFGQQSYQFGNRYYTIGSDIRKPGCNLSEYAARSGS
jgi:hypothetical protein